MAINFDKLVEESKKILNNKALYAVILGTSGGGKSTLCGTTGKKTLFICFRGEKHGPGNAAALGGDVVPFVVDMADDTYLSPDESYARLLDLLADPVCSRFGTIVLDGFPELESILVRTSAFTNGCLNDKGKHNTFAESRVMITLYKPVMERLNSLHQSGKHILVTCKLDVRAVDSETGEIEEAAPRMLTYSVADDLISKFPEIIVVGKMTNGTVWKHKLQFNTAVKKVAKDQNQQVRKFINFSPRISGIIELPTILDADLKKVIALKEKSVSA